MINRDTKKGRTPHAPLFYISLLKFIIYSFRFICLHHLIHSLLLDVANLRCTSGILEGHLDITVVGSTTVRWSPWVFSVLGLRIE